MMMGTRLLAVVGLVAGLAACGDDATPAGDTTTPDTTTPDTSTPDTSTPDTSTPDTSTPDTTPTDTTPTDTVTPTCDRTGFTGEAYMDYNEESGYVGFGLTGEAEELLLEFYDMGAGSPLAGPGEYPLGGNPDDQNYATCTTCGLIFTEDKVFFATSGLITITEIDEVARVVKATLTDATFVEVDINTETFESTEVPGGEGWCIPSAAIEYAPECTTNADCSGATPFCDTENFECVGCLSSLDCSADKPVCSATDNGVECIAGLDLCTGDDANEQSDDGPMGANALTLGTPVNAKICGDQEAESAAEFDWYTFTLAAPTNLEITLSWPGAEDVDFYFVDANLEAVQSGGATEANPEVVRATEVPAGTYYIAVNSYAGAPTAAVGYTLTVATFTPECTQDSDCTDAAKPACDTENLVCVVCVTDFNCSAATPVCKLDEAGVASCGVNDVCTGDDAGENGDDGPAGARALTSGTAVNGKICGETGTDSAAEADWFKVTVADGQNITVSLAWPGTGDLDVYVLDAEGMIVDDAATTANPEEVVITAPGAGTYFVAVTSYEGAPTDAVDYTLTVTVGQ